MVCLSANGVTEDISVDLRAPGQCPLFAFQDEVSRPLPQGYSLAAEAEGRTGFGVDYTKGVESAVGKKRQCVSAAADTGGQPVARNESCPPTYGGR